MLAAAVGLAAAALAGLGPGAASAEDRIIAAEDATTAALLTGGGVSGVFHRVEAGRALHFATPGPATLTVEVRRRLPAVGGRPPGVRVRLLGDGSPVMELVAGQPAVAGAKVHDGRGGAVSGPDLATVTVPEGGERLSVQAPAGSPDLLVQVRIAAPGS